MNNYGQKVKNNCFVNYPIKDLEVNSVKTTGKQNLYDLYAVGKHTGDTFLGHYIAATLDLVTQQWYNISDDSVANLPMDL